MKKFRTVRESDLREQGHTELLKVNGLPVEDPKDIFADDPTWMVEYDLETDTPIRLLGTDGSYDCPEDKVFCRDLEWIEYELNTLYEKYNGK